MKPWRRVAPSSSGCRLPRKPFDVDLAHQVVGVDGGAGVSEHRRERRGPALVVGLGEERHGRQLHGRRRGRQLRNGRAAGDEQCGGEEARR